MKDAATPVLVLPPGLGFRPYPNVPVRTPEDLFDTLLIWEPPRRGHRYVLGVDVGDGAGQDRSVIDVLRVGTLAEPDEQVAQFVTDSTDPVGLAAIAAPIGSLYKDADGEPAHAAVETNGHGIVTQTEMIQRYGYTNHFIWRHEDAVDPRARQTRSYGWQTNMKTRPMILTRLIRGIKTVDERTGRPDVVVNSPITLVDLRNFLPHEVYGASYGEASVGNHDDCIFALAIAVWISATLQLDDTEPLNERRRRLSEEQARRLELEARSGMRVEAINTDVTAEEAAGRPDFYGEELEWGHF